MRRGPAAESSAARVGECDSARGPTKGPARRNDARRGDGSGRDQNATLNDSAVTTKTSSGLPGIESSGVYQTVLVSAAVQAP